MLASTPPSLWGTSLTNYPLRPLATSPFLTATPPVRFAHHLPLHRGRQGAEEIKESKNSLVPPERGDVSLLTGGLLYKRTACGGRVIFQTRGPRSGEGVIFKCFYYTNSNLNLSSYVNFIITFRIFFFDFSNKADNFIRRDFTNNSAVSGIYHADLNNISVIYNFIL